MWQLNSAELVVPNRSDTIEFAPSEPVPAPETAPKVVEAPKDEMEMGEMERSTAVGFGLHINSY